MLIAIVIVLAVLAIFLALMGPTFGVFGVGNFRANKPPAQKPPKRE